MIPLPLAFLILSAIWLSGCIQQKAPVEEWLNSMSGHEIEYGKIRTEARKNKAEFEVDR